MRHLLLLALAVPLLAAGGPGGVAVPLPEHPRPDFQRPDWVNLNGEWELRFDTEDAGVRQAWFSSPRDFPRRITVPFPWGAPLSGVPDEADIGWYRRTITTPADWDGRRVFLVVGAADWRTTAWLDGHELGTHQGGYTPFALELTPWLRAGEPQSLVLRVDDTPHDFKLEGKQGYGKARGIWQTPYLEVRGDAALHSLHFVPDIDAGSVGVRARLLEPAPRDLKLTLEIAGVGAVQRAIAAGEQESRFDVPIATPHLWSLEDPYLYDVQATVSGDGLAADVVRTYFGMRDIDVVALPGTAFPYVALNHQPVYLQLTLDQAFHPGGFYTYPSDDFVRDEILRIRRLGLNGIRVHVKVGLPRKLYWADRLGVLVMADVPNSWGEPTPAMQRESTHALHGMIERDFNHPSIFSWVLFNETWGLSSGEGEERAYTDATKEWVASLVRETRAADPTRLVEDNSVCCGVGHTDTDIDSWHVYTTGWRMPAHLDEVVSGTSPGSSWNFEPGYVYSGQPLLNSEFGNVWGYEGSTGDVDWSWDYHIFVNAFRRHPQVAGWLYTELHDVINEWNGYVRYDRSAKFPGFGELVEGMSLRDLHAPIYVAVGEPGTLCIDVQPGREVAVPLWASFLTGSDAHGPDLELRWRLSGWDTLGRRHEYASGARREAYRPYRSEALEPLTVPMPDAPGVAVLSVEVADAAGQVLQRNFTTFDVQGKAPEEVVLDDDAGGHRARLLHVKAAAFTDARWSLKQWSVLDGEKVSGAGAGYFEYRLPWPSGLSADDVASASFVFEASTKRLYGKDRESGEMAGDYMLGGGAHDPGRNPNAYPMTDEDRYPGEVTVRAGGFTAGTFPLADDPADSRGILSWHAQPRDGTLHEAGSYGWLVRAPIPRRALVEAAQQGELVVRLEVGDALPRGLALYGRESGRYPVDPTLVLVTTQRGRRPRGSGGRVPPRPYRCSTSASRVRSSSICACCSLTASISTAVSFE